MTRLTRDELAAAVIAASPTPRAWTIVHPYPANTDAVYIERIIHEAPVRVWLGVADDRYSASIYWAPEPITNRARTAPAGVWRVTVDQKRGAPALAKRIDTLVEDALPQIELIHESDQQQIRDASAIVMRTQAIAASSNEWTPRPCQNTAYEQAVLYNRIEMYNVVTHDTLEVRLNDVKLTNVCVTSEQLGAILRVLEGSVAP